MISDKKQIRMMQDDYNLHIALVMKHEGVTRSKAQFIAYTEGNPGLNERLGQHMLKLGADTQ